MDKILTVVVPTYNAERYLRDSLESFLIEEILPDVEILIVNDGSTDRSLEIAEEYVRKYPNTYRVITKENGGHGSGINCGIRNAKGIYFKVVDADDWVEKTGFCNLVKILKNQMADVVYSGFLWTFDRGQEKKEDFETKVEIPVPFQGVVYGKQYKFDEIADRLYMKMHSMTIKTSILRENGILIDENCYYVDTEYITLPIPYVDSICFIDSNVYMYRIGRQGQSVGIDKMQKNEANYDRVIERLINFYQKLGNDIPCTEAKKRYLANLIARVVAGKIKIMLSFPASKKKQQDLKEFDKKLQTKFGDIYTANRNKAVWILRKTRYKTYRIASKMVKRIY